MQILCARVGAGAEREVRIAVRPRLDGPVAGVMVRVVHRERRDSMPSQRTGARDEYLELVDLVIMREDRLLGAHFDEERLRVVAARSGAARADVIGAPVLLARAVRLDDAAALDRFGCM